MARLKLLIFFRSFALAIKDDVTPSPRKPNDAMEIRLGQIPFANEVELSGEEIVCCGGMRAKRECAVCVDRYSDVGGDRVQHPLRIENQIPTVTAHLTF